VPRVTVIADVDSPGERESLKAWMERWRSRLTFTSENLGCGCCIDLYQVEAPDAAIAELPEMMKCADAGDFNDGA
jgi:hypothetical protein